MFGKIFLITKNFLIYNSQPYKESMLTHTHTYIHKARIYFAFIQQLSVL